MEFEDVSEEVEWECKRIAAAFGVTEWAYYSSGSDWVCSAKIGLKHLEWHLSSEPLRLTVIAIEQKKTRRTLAYFLPRFGMKSGANDALLARGLYCLGLEPYNTLTQLPELSAHEKMEARLSLPREFWPKRWLEEAEGLAFGKYGPHEWNDDHSDGHR